MCHAVLSALWRIAVLEGRGASQNEELRMNRLICWLFLIGIGLISIQSANANVDDTLEQIEDAA